MKITCLQMNMRLGASSENFAHAEQLIRSGMKEEPDVLVLPETWNTGFFPKENLAKLCREDGDRVRLRMGALAKEYHVNLVAGSVSNVREGRVFNTALVFDREGTCIASYDKTHLFTPMEEDRFYTRGSHLCRFTLDGVRCGLVICYDLRFPEIIRSLCLPGLDILFTVAQWPRERILPLQILSAARAIENQAFVVCCNSCGTAGETVYGGHSAIYSPLGEPLVLAGEGEEIVSAVCDESVLADIREKIPLFRDRRPDLYVL